MPPRSSPFLPDGMRARLIRAGIILLIGWIAIEAVLLQLVAARLGWGLTIAILSVKGGIGLVLLGAITIRGMFGLKKQIAEQNGVPASLRLGFMVASAVLISVPGLFPTLLGFALFSPSLQTWLLGKFRKAGAAAPPREIDLPAEEWREIRRRKPRKALPSRKGPLEGKPPSV